MSIDGDAVATAVLIAALVAIVNGAIAFGFEELKHLLAERRNKTEDK